FRTASRACESAAAVTVQVFNTTTSAEACSPDCVRPPARSSRRSAAASASVARQPKFSMEKVAMWLGVVSKMKRGDYSSERRRFTFPAGEKPGEEKNLRRREPIKLAPG